jgi:hypothetical protein
MRAFTAVLRLQSRLQMVSLNVVNRHIAAGFGEQWQVTMPSRATG